MQRAVVGLLAAAVVLLVWLGYGVHELRSDMRAIGWTMQDDVRLMRLRAVGQTEDEKLTEMVERNRRAAARGFPPEETTTRAPFLLRPQVPSAPR